MTSWNWNAIDNAMWHIFILVFIASVIGRWCWRIIRGALEEDDCELTDEEDAVICAAQKLYAAGEVVNAGELPSIRIHELYDAVRAYEASQE